ncbi:hypothetical protein Micbo1qcDRAFT_127588 [Microdochium bolleyi]|uniref:Transcription factor domain-containing protein n=1 Tax=Microdochium bolleyi TaxID=196109 RepID=A0A136IL75_9PEZI|nr:hypothetical protein Micbo1qcDRAFT_127588 [Microdochium bolleyi]
MKDLDSALGVEASRTPLTAPLMVIREIGSRFPAPLRKVRSPTAVKLIDEELLDEDTARGLLQSVCCLNAIAEQHELAQTTLHRRIFMRVKAALGLVLLDHSPSLDDIQGILMCSDSFRVGAGDGKEFIDSWMLTGYCAKQAMIAIDFERIAKETREGRSSAENVRAIRLWSTICLHHLHWTAASGRPSTIAESYLHHCPLLLNFCDATVQDGILLAEVFLYSNLLAVLDKVPELSDDDDCNAFESWRHEWRHLLALPSAAMLKMGYASACLLLVVRGLEEQGEQLSPAAFLPEHPPALRQIAAVPGHVPSPSLCRVAARQAQTLLQTFLGMPKALQDSISSNRCLCLTYAALVLAHYDKSQSGLEDKDNLLLVRRLHAWFRDSPRKVVLARYTSLCEHIITTRIDQISVSRAAHANGDGDSTMIQDAFTSGSTGVGVESRPDAASDMVPNGDATQPDDGDISALFDMLPTINLEDFFAGGYLEM